MALIVAAASIVAVQASQALGGDTGHTGDRSGVATVTRGPLTAQLHATGTLEYLAQADGSPYTVIDHATGTLTALPAVGRVIEQGQVLYRVADAPVVLLDGATPAYRSLSEGDSGPDVRQLNADLVALSLATSSQLDPSSDYFSASTAVALEKLQARLGLNQTGTLPLGEAVFLPAPIRITAVTATLGTGYSPNPSGTGPATPRPEFVDLTTTVSPPTAPADADPTKCKPQKRKHSRCRHPRRGRHRRPGRHRRGPGPRTRPGATAPGAVGKPGARPGSHNGAAGRPARPTGGSGSHNGAAGKPARPTGGSGSPGGGPPAPTPAKPILQATSTRREVVVPLDARAARAVKVGQRALISLPSGRTTTGTITRIGTAAGASGTVSVDVSLEHPGLAGGLDQASVQVRITTAAVTSALRVPVTALVELPDGRFAVKTIGTRGGTRLVPVQVGLFDDATGLIQVTGPLSPGEQVLEPGG
jgi:hypothetical protein